MKGRGGITAQCMRIGIILFLFLALNSSLIIECLAGEKPAKEQTEDQTSYLCKACREAIQADASICPHCGTSQRGRSWAILGDILKWLNIII